MEERARSLNNVLNRFYFINYWIVAGLVFRYFQESSFPDLLTVVFSVAVYLSYSFLYLLPSLVITKLSCVLLGVLFKQKTKLLVGGIYLLSSLTMGITFVFLYFDRFIFDLYGFHLNGFVWNLLFTRGGVASLGSDQTTMFTFAFLVTVCFIAPVVLLWGLRRYDLPRFCLAGKPRFSVFLCLVFLVVLLSVGERVTYGICEFRAHTSVLLAANSFPFYTTTTFHSLAARLGLKAPERRLPNISLDAVKLAYPLSPLEVEKPQKPLNIVWLVCESLRADMMVHDIMPKSWDFAQKSWSFRNHYSGGNGTRMGTFSMFYGLYGPYWFPFLALQNSPVIMDVLQQQDYQFFLHTSQSFSYPELDKTVFARFAPALFHEDHEGYGWQRDQRNVSALIERIESRVATRPFMAFMFFESPHARYYFPEDSIIRRPYLETFNYATAITADNVAQIKNRYINACHYLDSQIGRVFEFLEKDGLLDNTIVVLAGDHGEEFMEKGRWGHNSEFSQEQIQSPLVLWIPGQGAGSVDRMTSHLDVVPTLMPLLGVKNPSKDYCLGYNLLGGSSREFTVVADWENIGFLTDEYKVKFPVKARSFFQSKVTTRDDLLVVDEQAVFSNNRDQIMEVMRDLTKFSRKQD